jgi:hypothetical protein
MSKSTPRASAGLELLDQIGEVEKALAEIAGPLVALATLLESNAEVDEEVKRGLAVILRGLSERSRGQIPTLRTVTHTILGPVAGPEDRG